MTPWDGDVYLKHLQYEKVVMPVTLMKQNDWMIHFINMCIHYQIWNMPN